MRGWRKGEGQREDLHEGERLDTYDAAGEFLVSGK